MRIARELGGYTMGQADLLRRAMGKKIASRNGDASRDLHQGRGGTRRAGRRRRTDLRAGREIRGLRLQQGPRRGLRAGRLSDGLSEGELSGRIPRRLDDARHRHHRPPQRLPPGGAAARHQGRCRRTSTAPKPSLPATRTTSVIYYALAAVKGVGRQAMDHLVAHARGRRAVPVASAISRAASIPSWSTSAPSKAWCAPARSMRSIAQPPAARGVRRRDSERIRAHRPRARSPGNRRCSAKRRQRGRSCGCRRSTIGCRMRRLSEEFSAIGFYLSGHPLDDYEAALKRLGAITYRRAERRSPPFQLQGRARGHDHQANRNAAARTISLTASSRSPIPPACSK